MGGGRATRNTLTCPAAAALYRLSLLDSHCVPDGRRRLPARWRTLRRVELRLKDNWKPRMDRIHRGEVTGTFFPGTDLDALLEAGTLVLDGRVVDAGVTLGPPGQTVSCWLVGVPAPDGTYRFYLTNLPRTVGPHSIADIYRVRWEIESDNKLDKSCSHLDQISARTVPATPALIHASIVSSMLACLIVHKHRLGEPAPPGSRDRQRYRNQK